MIFSGADKTVQMTIDELVAAAGTPAFNNPERGYLSGYKIEMIPTPPGWGIKKERKALANIGLIALIDEATGFQDTRPPDALATKYKEYLDG